MADRPSEPVIDARLRDYLAAEFRQAESDFPHLPHPAGRRARRRLPAGILVAVVVLVGAIVVVPRFIGTSPSVSGGSAFGPDGLPVSIDGEPVLRGSDIAGRIGSSTPFLAGGTLVLRSKPCPSPTAASQAGCPEEWQLAADPAGASSEVFALDKVTAAPGFVRTSGALTVVRVASSRASSPASAVCGAGCGGVLTVREIVWRRPTKGGMPDNAAPAGGGFLNEALVPDFVSAWGQGGVTIAGYVPKRYLVGTSGQDSPQPVYEEDLTTLVGYMVPGKGFVPLGVDPNSIPTFPVQQGPAVSAPAGPSMSLTLYIRSAATKTLWFGVVPASDAVGAVGATIPVLVACLDVPVGGQAVMFDRPPQDAGAITLRVIYQRAQANGWPTLWVDIAADGTVRQGTGMPSWWSGPPPGC
jgi:hypothetical protein